MSRSGSALFVVVLTLAACGTSVKETFISDPPSPMTPRERYSVLVYASTPPTRPHIDVAKLEVEERHGIDEKGVDFAIDRLRTRAAAIGCDGVVVSGIRERDAIGVTSLPGGGYRLLNPNATTLRGRCIVFVDPPPAGGECPCHAR
jgi:hypothetical protein